MANTRQAPKLIFNGTKPKDKTYYNLPQSLMDNVFDIISGKNGNAIKLMVVLLGTLGDGSFKVSEQWVKNRTGMPEQRYNEARLYLERVGLITTETGKITVNIDKIMEHKIKADELPEDDTIKADCVSVASFFDETGFRF